MNDWRDHVDGGAEPSLAARAVRDGGRVWFITGCSSGFGKEVAGAALARGDRVVATARDVATLADLEDEASPGQLLACRLDLEDGDSITAAVGLAVDRFSGLDVVLNNAGIATLGAIEEVGDELLRRQLEINLFGTLAVTRAVLPVLRAGQGGHILQMSSMGGRCAFPGLGAYHASKWGLEGASVALAQEVAPFGIRVTLIEPGDFRTPVLSPQRLLAGEPMAEYSETVGIARAGVAALDGNQPGDPRRLAAAILTIVEADDPPLHLALGSDCYERLKADLESQLQELERWSDLTRSTDLPH
jgi:NAD(P)-dependent dehydrogenase (short-subunit alcohol dehydrogenase family)